MFPSAQAPFGERCQSRVPCADCRLCPACETDVAGVVQRELQEVGERIRRDLSEELRRWRPRVESPKERARPGPRSFTACGALRPEARPELPGMVPPEDPETRAPPARPAPLLERAWEAPKAPKAPKSPRAPKRERPCRGSGDARRRSYRQHLEQAVRETGTARVGLAVRLACLVRSDAFDHLVGAVLLANAALLGFQADYFAEAKRFSPAPVPDPATPLAFRLLDLAFCAVFVVELALRVSVSRCAFLRGEGWRWNLFDALVVLLQILDEIVKMMFGGTVVQEHFKNVGVVRVLRLARLLRLVRMVRLIPELKSMVYLIYASIGSFIWSLVLILIMMYCYAIYYTEIVTDMVNGGLVPESDFDDLQTRWGGLGVSVLTLWMAITGGDDWRNFTDILRHEKLYALHLILFIVYIAFGTLVMLNLVTGVFVESAQRIMREDKDAELMNLASKIFTATDLDGSQEITIEEFQEQLDTGLMHDYVEAIGIRHEELEHLYELLDQDDSGTVNAGEFVKGCLRLRGPARALDMAEMEYRMRESFHHLAFAMAQVSQATHEQAQQTNMLWTRLEQTIVGPSLENAWDSVNVGADDGGPHVQPQRFEEVLV